MTEAEFTEDKIEKGFFGSGKVAVKKGMNDRANYMATSDISITWKCPSVASRTQ